MATPLPTIIFDDGRGQLAPLNDLRAAFDIRTGALSVLQRLRRDAHLNVVAWSAPDPLHASTRGRTDLMWMGDLRSSEPMLVVNARCPLLPEQAIALRTGQALIEDQSGDVIAARVAPSNIAAAIRSDVSGLTVQRHPTPALLSRPWHIRTFRDRCIDHDLALFSPQADRLVASTATVHTSVIFDAAGGKIVIDEHAVIRPGAIICGPAYIGPHSTVLDRCLIKPHTAIGPHCKVAGEVGGTIFQGYANKAHDGHLGDSWVGEWANLGAGTTNSNLLNTYGEVVCRPFGEDGKPGPNERTGQQFLGAIIGDHAKFAICTRIMTGAIVGTGTMWAATSPVTGTVPPFSWVTDAGTRAYAIEKFIEVLKAAMARRKIEPSAEYVKLVRDRRG